MERVTFSEEAMFISKSKPGYVTKNYSQVEEKIPIYVMPKPKKEAKKAKEIVGPATYNIEQAFKNTQLETPKFYISKYKTDNYINM